MDRDRNLPAFKVISSKLQTLISIRAIPNSVVANYGTNLEELLVLLVRASSYSIHDFNLISISLDEMERHGPCDRVEPRGSGHSADCSGYLGLSSI